MNMTTIVVLIVSAIFAFLLMGTPVYAGLGAAGVIGLLLMQTRGSAVAATALIAIPQNLYAGMSSFTLLAIPFYVLAGEIMNKSGITDRLIRLAVMIVGRVPGGLAYANVLDSMFFGGITGSAQADTSCTGSVMIPSMIKEGYPKGFSVAITAATSSLGPIIPPSIMLVLYGVTTGSSISALFMGGYIPGILVGVAMICLVTLMNKKYHFPRREEALTWKERFAIIKDGLYPLGMPIIICGGIITGIVTPTEAGVLAIVYSMIIGMVVLKSLKWSDMPGMLLRTATMSGRILLIIGCAKIASYALTGLQMSTLLGNLFLQFSDSPQVFLLLVNILLLIMGMFMDGGASILLLAPVLTPIATMLGIDLVHFGLVMVLNLVIGLGTPPLGQCVYIASDIAKIPVMEGFKSMGPFIICEIIVLLIVTYLPWTVTAIPTFMGLM